MEPHSTEQHSTEQHWIAQHSRPVIFLILTLGLLGAYLAFTIPVSVFPGHEFSARADRGR